MHWRVLSCEGAGRACASWRGFWEPRGGSSEAGELRVARVGLVQGWGRPEPVVMVRT